MQKIILVFIFIISMLCENSLPFSIEVEELNFASQIPALQSFSLAEHDNNWLIIGGLSDGTHGDGKQIFATGQFPQKNFNERMWVISPQTGEVWSQAIPKNLAATLNVANPQYYKIDDNTLCIVGGYGINRKNRHDTMGVMTWIDVPKTITAIKNNEPVEKHLWQLFDERLCVTGGELKYIDGEFFLVAGQKFSGKYMEDEKQHYTLQIRRFEVDVEQKKITSYQAIGEESLHIRESKTVTTLANPKRYTHDLNKVLRSQILRTIKAHGKSLDSYIAEGGDGESHLRRRDLNVTEAVFPDGTHGFVLYGGGFKFLFPLFTMHQNPIFFSPQKQFSGCNAMIDMGFEQTMSLYTCAHMLIFDPVKRKMRTVLFGGISAFAYDEVARETVRDRMLPYVNNISIETISGSKSPSSWQCKETVIEKNNRAQTFGQKGFFGTNSKFVLSKEGKQALYGSCHEVLDLEILQKKAQDSITIGYIYGGIHALKQNFGKTTASNKIFAVRLRNVR
ncbi:hypothetical protein [Candidatus Uabimicrobium sp. HlEnr_7]|uniref:hypothetical protein n=1 Tax=Candidatus Uabimicrobium helgolandensis TaxID=3095367 RepID=UPI00355766E1